MVEQQQQTVYRDMMTRFLGRAIMTAIDDPAVTEIYTNPHDQRIWVIRHAEGRMDTGVGIDPSSVLSFLNTVATSLRTTIGPAARISRPSCRSAVTASRGFRGSSRRWSRRRAS